MRRITKDTAIEYLLMILISACITMFGNCINIITDKNPDTFVSVLEGIPGLLILVAIGYAL